MAQDACDADSTKAGSRQQTAPEKYLSRLGLRACLSRTSRPALLGLRSVEWTRGVSGAREELKPSGRTPSNGGRAGEFGDSRTEHDAETWTRDATRKAVLALGFLLQPAAVTWRSVFFLDLGRNSGTVQSVGPQLTAAHVALELLDAIHTDSRTCHVS